MASTWIVPALDEPEDGHAGLRLGSELSPVEQLAFERGEEALAHRVVVGVADRKPYLILGGDLVDFLKVRAKPKHKCEPHECYCVKCRKPRRPAGDMAEFVPLNPSSGNLRAFCPVCEKLMHRRVSTTKLATLRTILDVTIVEADEPITDTPSPSLNDHLDQESESHA